MDTETERIPDEKVQEYEEQAKKRRLVLPGDELGYGIAGSGTYIEHGKIISKVIGLAEVKNDHHFVIPLNGVYTPKRGDGVIGIIKEVGFSKWTVDINSPYSAVLSLSEGVNEFVDLTKTDLTKYYDLNDIIFAKVQTVTKSRMVVLTMKDRRCRKLFGGRIIKITPTKVPRVIGKNGSMVELIKKKTKCQIVVGQNGLVWIRGEYRHLAAEAIKKIEAYAHIVGLTNKIDEFLTKKLEETGISEEIKGEKNEE
ncbi:MAG: RNA-binding protein [Candidatus Aenigmarchaeota archaeon]|nr:RNA-binding protein [Candidatus Aenigmarchaeota archaeon]